MVQKSKVSPVRFARQMRKSRCFYYTSCSRLVTLFESSLKEMICKMVFIENASGEILSALQLPNRIFKYRLRNLKL